MAFGEIKSFQGTHINIIYIYITHTHRNLENHTQALQDVYSEKPEMILSFHLRLNLGFRESIAKCGKCALVTINL